MSTKKDIAIQKILTEFEMLSNLVLSQLDTVEMVIDNGEVSFTESESEEFYNNEEKIDKLEVKLSDRIVNSIVLYQPVAGEIRQIISIYRIVINMERVGDHAVELVDFMKSIKSLKVYNELSELINSMFVSSVQLLKKALFAFVQQDKESATWVLKNRNEDEALNQKTLKKLIEKSKEFDEKKKVIISFITIKEMLDNIQRIADHATNIAESAIYFLEGKDIRHTPFFED